ncbi:MAG: response regulator, partial [Prevotellaceae bacterium]|nr:response regulator [Prevotellaceae bacterium]
MKRFLYLILLLLPGTFPARAQQDCLFTHYSSENGLSQNTIMSILQDRKGNMWFSTWDGINKFDGYNFEMYKARFDNRIALSHNRIDHMAEDIYGYIWVVTYDGHAYRFDPRTQTFCKVPAEGREGAEVQVNQLVTLPSGVVWLLTESEGAIRVAPAVDGRMPDTQLFSRASGLFPATRVFEVHQDRQGNEWVLSDNGLCLLEGGSARPVSFFVENSEGKHSESQGFYSCLENDTILSFGSDNGRVWCYHKATKQFKLRQLPAASRVNAIGALPDGAVLYTTSRSGVVIVRPGGRIDQLPADRFPPAYIYTSYIDRHGEVWFEQHLPGTVAHLDPRTLRVQTENMLIEPTSSSTSRPAFHIHEDAADVLWVQPYAGGFSYYDRAAGRLRPFYNAPNAPDWRFSNKIHAAFSDRQGNLWLCTHSKGLEKVTFRRPPFHLKPLEAFDYESLSNEVRALCEADGNLFVGAKDGKIRLYDANRSYRGYLTRSGGVAPAGEPLGGNAYFICQDSRGNLWIATKGDGVVRARPTGEPFRYHITRYRHNPDDIYSLSNDDVYCISEDGQGRIWMATFGGGINYLSTDETGREVFINHRNHLKNYPIDPCYRVRCLTVDGSDRLWIGTTAGAMMLDTRFKNPEEVVFHRYIRVPGQNSSLSGNDVHWIVSTGSDELYLATFGGGLNKLLLLDDEGRAQFKSYTAADGLSSDALLSVREDGNGNLWISTENGISRFDPARERFENYDDRGISFHVRFSEAASAYVQRNRILFGASTGIFYFTPDSIRKSHFVPPLVFSRLLIANKEVEPADSSSILHVTIDDTPRLRLSHRENIFTLQFAALDYLPPAEIQYAYRLEGFESVWNYVGKQRTATYTNLPKGEYLFQVRSTNSDGVWTENTRSLPIEILPSFWETPLAYTLYVFIVLIIIFSAAYILFLIYRLKHEVSVEQQITDMKLRFFTDVSHELRTPLTLIAGPIEHILKSDRLTDDTRTQLQVVERNTSRMLRLVNQILDFRKIQNKKMRLHVSHIDLVAFARKVMANFEGLAGKQQIDFLFETEEPELFVWVDVDKVEKILFNLLSNAFKYTPTGKMITLFIQEDEARVSVGVRDQGVGIAESKQKNLFVRFENFVDRNLFNQSSTGIGLSMVKELAELHQATVSVESKVGKGSCFKVDFLKGKEHYNETVDFLCDDTAVEVEAPVSPDADTPSATPEALPAAGAKEKVSGTMLLVEDNAELRTFLRTIFAGQYRIIEAENGAQGYSKAVALQPDIIISDVMMPERDGIAMTRDLRSHLNTSHIPIILLTARD